MSLKFKFMSIFASIVVLGSAAVVASAQDPVEPKKDKAVKAEKADKQFGKMRGFGRRGHGKMRGAIGFRGIELTEAQKEQMKQIREANRPDPSVMEELKSFREARRAGNLTEDQKTRIKAIHDQMRAKSESVRQQVLNVLTPEQKQQIETRREEMRKRMEERRRLRETRSTTSDKKDGN